MLPKSNERLLVGYNDGACAVKYYHRETCKILTSRNYQFVEKNYKLPPVPDQGSHIKIECNNKPIQSTKGVPRPSVRSEELSWPKKRPADGEIETEMRQTRGACVDYKQLDDPFSDSEEDEDTMIAIHIMINDESYNATTNNGPMSLKDAKKLPNWPDWKRAIGAELEQL